MHPLVAEVQTLTRGYVRKGGKDNRRQQAARMIAFAQHAASMGARSMGQVGARHVLSYWRAHRGLSSSTLYAHWLAIRALYRLAGRKGEPPRPLAMMGSGQEQHAASEASTAP